MARREESKGRKLFQPTEKISKEHMPINRLACGALAQHLVGTGPNVGREEAGSRVKMVSKKAWKLSIVLILNA